MNWKFLHCLNLFSLMLTFGCLVAIRKVKIATASVPPIEDQIVEWKGLCDHITQMMINSDEVSNQKIEVIIFSMTLKKHDVEYEGFELMLSKFGNERMTFSLFSSSSIQRNSRGDFVILILDSKVSSFGGVIEKYFDLIFEDQTTKFFILMRDEQVLQSTWMSLIKTRYYNAYFIILMKKKEFIIVRTVLKGIRENTELTLQETRLTKYQKINDIIRNEQIKIFNVIVYNSFPTSYVENNVIIGSAGNLVREFSKIIRVPYNIINNPKSSPSVKTIFNLFLYGADISLFPTIFFESNKFKTIWINEVDGICLLIPRNIHVSSFDNFVLPLDKASIIHVFILSLMIIITWIVISILKKNQRSISSILFAVFELALNFGASGLEDLTIQENFLVYSYIFSSFILVSFYESIFLALMLTESTYRSADSIQELIESQTKFYTYVDIGKVSSEFFPIIPDELIINKIDLQNQLALQVPQSYDKNLVYLVFCQYADNFLDSSKNFVGNTRVFDKMKLGEHFQHYTARKGFFFADEFVNLIVSLRESGIYSFWYKQVYELSLGNMNAVADIGTVVFDIISFSGMHVPIVVLLIGCLVSFMVLIAEIIVSRFTKSSLKPTTGEENIEKKLKRKRNLKLSKWMQKYKHNRNLKYSNKNKTQKDEMLAVNDRYIARNAIKESIKERESLSGAYFAIKKFKKPVTQRTRLRKIKVKSCYAESSL